MARPRKVGLDYLPLDTEFDESEQALEAAYGNDGLAVFVKILQAAYKSKKGEVDVRFEHQKLSLARKCNMTVERFVEVLSAAIELGLFSQKDFTSRNVITSRGIKKRLKFVSARREKWREAHDNKGVKPGSNQQVISPDNVLNGAIKQSKSKGKRIIGEEERERGAAESFPHTQPTEEQQTEPSEPPPPSSAETQTRVIESNEDRERRLAEGFTYPHDRYPESRGDIKRILDRVADRRKDLIVKVAEAKTIISLYKGWGMEKILAAIDAIPTQWHCTTDQIANALVAIRDGRPINETSQQNSNGRQSNTNGTTAANRQPSEQYRRATRQPTAEDFAVAYAVNVNPTSIEDSG